MNPTHFAVALWRTPWRVVVLVCVHGAFLAVVCATPAVESLGSCREGAGSIPAVRVAALPKRRLAAGARLQRMRPPRRAAWVQDAQAARAAGGGGGAFLWGACRGSGVWGDCLKKRSAPPAAGARGLAGRVCCCRGRWCVNDDRRIRTSAIGRRVYVADHWSTPGLLHVCGTNMHIHGLHTHCLPRGAVMVAGFNFGGVKVEDFPVSAPEACGSVW